jgi:hypothetical protein
MDGRYVAAAIGASARGRIAVYASRVTAGVEDGPGRRRRMTRSGRTVTA